MSLNFAVFYSFYFCFRNLPEISKGCFGSVFCRLLRSSADLDRSNSGRSNSTEKVEQFKTENIPSFVSLLSLVARLFCQESCGETATNF